MVLAPGQSHYHLVARALATRDGAHLGKPRHSGEVADRVIGRPVYTQAVPRDTWQSSFFAQGMHNPLPQVRRLEGWIAFEGMPQKGETTLDTVFQELIKRHG